MAPTIAEIVTSYPDDPALVERIAHRTTPLKMNMADYDPAWPDTFLGLKALIINVLGSTAVDVEHVGSTSVPGLPAKAVIDIDLIVADPEDESAYVAQLEAAGFHFLLREPSWQQHRFFCHYSPVANLHVWGSESVEPIRHKIFRDWLRNHPDDKDAYATVKRGAIAESRKLGEHMMQYTDRKNAVIAGILRKAFRSLGYLE